MYKLQLENRGQICYINVVLQLLTHVMYATGVSFGTSPAAKWIEALAVKKFSKTAAVVHTKDIVANVNSFVDADYRYCGHPNDADELFFQLLNAFKTDDRVNAMFGFKFICVTECFECKTQTYRRELNTKVQVPVAKAHSLRDAFASIFASEEMAGENAYACDTCRVAKNDATYKTMARRFIKTEAIPLIIAVQFSRFNGGRFGNQRIDQELAFPFVFNTEIGEDFKLLFVILHKGTSSSNGHYYAAGRVDDTHIMEYNDDKNELLDMANFLASPVVKKDVYMVFYEKVGK